MVIEQQISARRERAHGSIVRILTRPDGNLYGDYSVRSASNKTYRVAMRGPGLFDNYCACPDYAVNTLGTCKHIEAVLLSARSRFGRKLDQLRYQRKHTTIYLDYREPARVRIVSPAKVSAELLALKEEFFDAEGFLNPH